MATGRIPDPNSAPITAKGDLYTYSTVPARLAVGNNGETLVADSSATTGLRWQSSTAAGRNFVINGGMDIWQRGTSISVAASSGITYTADRWCLNTGANQAITISRQATGDTTNLPNIQYCTRYQRNSGQTGTGGLFLSQSIETVNAIPLAGTTVTLSFYARSGANYSAASSALSAIVYTGTGTDQNQLSGFTGSATPINSTATLTTTWQRFSYSATISTTATQIATAFYFVPSGTAGANDWYEITGVQLELGSVATAFTRTGGTFAGELAACQRYFVTLGKTVPSGTGAANSMIASGGAYSTTVLVFSVPYPVPLRTTPIMTVSNLRVAVGANIYTTGTWVADSTVTDSTCAGVTYTHGTAVFTSGQAAYTSAASNPGYMYFSAEL